MGGLSPYTGPRCPSCSTPTTVAGVLCFDCAIQVTRPSDPIAVAYRERVARRAASVMKESIHD